MAEDDKPRLVYLDGSSDAEPARRRDGGGDGPPASDDRSPLEVDEAAFGPPPEDDGELLDLAAVPASTGTVIDPGEAASGAESAVRGIAVSPRSVEAPGSDPVNPIEPALSLVARIGLFLVALPISLLPSRLRRRLPFERLPMVAATVVSAVLTGVLVVAVVAHAVGGADDPSGFVQRGAAALILLYFLVEAVVRILAAVALGRGCATLPLWLVEQGWLAGLHARDRLRYGPVVADDLDLDGDALIIASCRPRDFAGQTLEYRNRLYRLTRQREQPGPHRFVYRLEPISRYHQVGRIHYYSPDELTAWRRRAPDRPPGSEGGWLERLLGRSGRS